MYLQSIEITGALGKNYEIPAAESVVDDVLLANGQRSQRYANVWLCIRGIFQAIDIYWWPEKTLAVRGVERWCLSAAPHLSGRASLPFSSRTKNCQAGETTRPWKYWKPLWQLWQPVSTESGAPSYTKLHGCTQSNFIQVLHSSKRKRRED